MRSLLLFLLLVLTQLVAAPKHPCDPEAIKALEKMASKWAHERENYEKAAELYQSILDCQPQNTSALYGYGELLIVMKRFPEAEKVLKKANRLDPGNVEVLIALNHLAAARGKRELAKEYLDEALQCAACHPKGIEVLVNNAFYWEKRYPMQAAKIYRHLLKCEPDDEHILYRASKTAYRIGDYEAAARYLEKLSREHPKNKRYLRKLGQAGIRSGSYKIAAQAYINFIKVEGCNDIAINNLKQLLSILMKKKEYKIAREAATYLIECRPFEVRYLLTYAEATHKLGEKKALSETVKILNKDIVDFNKLGLKEIYLLIWDEKYEEALARLEVLFDQDPCNPTVMEVMDEAAARLTKSKKNLDLALETYHILLNCSPDSPLYYYRIAIVKNRMGDKQGAEEYFKKALEVDPNFIEAELELSTLYMREKRYKKGMAISNKYPDAYQARENFGRMALENQDFPGAESHFYNLIEEYPTSDDAKLLYAKSLVKQKNYKAGQREYDRYLLEQPTDRFTWRELYEFKEFTDPLYGFGIRYLESKEEDPDLKEFVVKNYFFRTRYWAFYPISDRARFTIEGDYGFQKENNIFGQGGRNYDVEISEVRAGWHYFIGNYWKIDLFNRVKIGNRLHDSFFPFQNRAKVEPGAAISYADKNSEWLLTGYYDSFIIKNRQQIISQLLRRKNVELFWERTYWEHPIYPRIGATGEINYYEDRFNNRRRRIGAHTGFNFPYIQDYANFTYRALYSEFSKLSPDYNTYFHRWEHFLTLDMRYITNSDTLFGFTYEHSWQFTTGQVLPVGLLLFVTPKQKIISNRYVARVSRSLGDTFFMEARGGYMESDLKYRDWHAHCSLVYHF